MRKVSLERCYFVLYDGALTLNMSKMALNPFCDIQISSFFLKAIDAETPIVIFVGTNG